MAVGSGRRICNGGCTVQSEISSFTPFKTAEAKKSVEVSAGRTNNGKLLACYDVVLDRDGYLSSYKRIGEDDDAEGTKWYAFMEIIGESDWFNGKTYADTLSKDAVDRFVEVTHENTGNAQATSLTRPFRQFLLTSRSSLTRRL